MRFTASVIGHFGEGSNLLNGQTIKTKIITEELQNRFGREKVLKIDTHGGWRTLLKSPFHVFCALKHSENILIFPAHNGVKVYVPLLAIQKRLFNKRKIHYIVIGGWLPQFLLKHKSLVKYLMIFDGIYVETYTMKKALEAQGFKNIFVMPNGKKLVSLTEEELIVSLEKPYKLCTFSRVMKEKGIEDAIEAVISANEKLGYTAFSLDIYGQIEDTQLEWFEEQKRKFTGYIHYGGLVSFDKSVEVLKTYFALLFPTYYEGEGFAGTLIDAFSAGVPIIASDWKYNSEIVTENVGLLYPANNQMALVNILLEVADNPTILLSKKYLCLQEAEKYKIDKVIHVLFNQMGGQ